MTAPMEDKLGRFGRGQTLSPRPKIVVLCGSTRFSEAFQEANLRETIAGNIVLSIGCDLRSDHQIWADLPSDEQAELKTRLDDLHLRKIDLADEVLILNVGGYIGRSTRRELIYAVQHNKPVRYLEPDSAPVAGDDYNGFTIDAYKVPGAAADARVVLRKDDGTVVLEFTYPMYRVWTLLAHWRDADAVNPNTAAATANEAVTT